MPPYCAVAEIKKSYWLESAATFMKLVETLLAIRPTGHAVNVHEKLLMSEAIPQCSLFKISNEGAFQDIMKVVWQIDV